MLPVTQTLLSQLSSTGVTVSLAEPPINDCNTQKYHKASVSWQAEF